MEIFNADLRSHKPNNYFLGADGKRRKAHGPAPIFSASVSDIKQALLTVINHEPRVRAIETEESALVWRFIQKTKIIGFVDDIAFQFQSSEKEGEAETALSIFSASRLGYSDLGVNQRRVQDWLKKLTDSIGAEKRLS